MGAEDTRQSADVLGSLGQNGIWGRVKWESAGNFKRSELRRHLEHRKHTPFLACHGLR